MIILFSFYFTLFFHIFLHLFFVLFLDVNDLLALADLDINPFRIKYLVSTSDILQSQEDSLVVSRLSVTPPRRTIVTPVGRKR